MTNSTPEGRKSPLDHDPEAVRWALKKSGFKQYELAAALDISVGHLSDVLSGRRNAPPHLLQQMARVLNCPVVVLEAKRYPAAV